MTVDTVFSPWIDPEMSPILDAMRERARERPSAVDIPIDEFRRRTHDDLSAWTTDIPAGVEMADEVVGTTFGDCRVRTVTPPEVADGDGVLVWLHGGGFVLGDVDTHKQLAAEVALATRMRVAVPEYKLAPEHPFPAPLESACELISALAADAADSGQSNGRWFLGGDSAGAWLAVAAALRRRDAGLSLPRAMTLIYPVVTPRLDSESYRRLGRDFGLTTEAMAYFWRCFLADAATEQQVDLLTADLSSLPPQHVLAAGLDPLLSENVAFANRLCDAGVATRLELVPGVVHGYVHMTRALSAARQSVASIGVEIDRHRSPR